MKALQGKMKELNASRKESLLVVNRVQKERDSLAEALADATKRLQVMRAEIKRLALLEPLVEDNKLLRSKLCILF